MKLSEDERKEYEGKIAGIVQIITADSDEARQLFPAEAILAREMLPEEPVNQRVLTAVKGAHLAFSVAELKRAMRAFFATLERDSKCQSVLDIKPASEREYITAFMRCRGYDMDFHRMFFGPDKTPKRVEDIANDARLTAGDLDLIKPRGDTLSVTEIGVALAEWANRRRAERKDIAAARVATLTGGRNARYIDERFTQVCEWYFAEPGFAEAACRKFIWQTKRRLLRLPVVHVHMVVLVGGQHTGKTVFSQTLYAPIGELAIEASLPDLLDTRQMDMPEYYVAFCDEMAFAENAKPAHLKTFLNGSMPSRRPMRSNLSEQIQVNVTLLATANHSLDKLIFDSSGMRRFVEIKPRTRPEIEPHWDAIVGFDWLGLWQSIDPHGPDPLVSKFEKELMVKQEGIRNQDNTELWLREFDAEEHRAYARHDTSSGERIEYYAQDLYERFRYREQDFDPGFRGTSLQRWGKDMRSLIANGSDAAAGWSYRIASNRTIYTKVLPMRATNQIVPLKQAQQRRR